MASEKVESAMLFFHESPTVDEWSTITTVGNKKAISLTGTAVRPTGPLIGLVDIGVSQKAYLFRMYLPGVKRGEDEFSIEVESSGRVTIKGESTTGEKLVVRNNQVFEMQTQTLCPSGEFSVSFQLPGRVEYQEFQGSFGFDGIFEGIVLKERMKEK
ncbi:alpha-crystallin domain-containing protein 22.3-like [Tasmannia lanceolata]|uniref:alpha-crystallin domain-containing protein 22.3-like n=1 Tax=Tasmannia lanceolata TaxID=3420 RepID=UPI004063D192